MRYALSSIENHYKSFHPLNHFQRYDMTDLKKFGFKLESSTVYQNDKLKYVFAGFFGMTEFPNCYKACLISTEPPDEVEKIKCTMKMVYFGKEIISTCGKVFSIDKTENIHVSTSGGLIYPKEIVDFFSDVQILIEINENGC